MNVFQAAGAVAIAAATLALACTRPVVPPPAPARLDGREVRLLTYNVNFGLAGDPETLDAITDARADLVLLQETTPAWEEALREALSARYPHMAFRHRGGAGGLAVLSRLPMRAFELLPPPGEGWFPAARIVVETSSGPLQLLNVHLHPPVSEGGSFVSGYFSTRAVRADEIVGHVARLDPALPTVIAGDFNEEADGRVTAFLRGRGYISALPRFAPGQPTWRWETTLMTFRKQLDHVVHDRRIEPISVTVLQAGRSDHLPVLAVIRPAAAP